MRIESPILERCCAVWRAVRDDRVWLCADAVRVYWDVGRAKKIVMVASSVRVAGAQKANVSRRIDPGEPTIEYGRYLNLNRVCLLNDGGRRLVVYPMMYEWLKKCARAFGSQTFWGWIEVVE
jgi:hypothetical protein